MRILKLFFKAEKNIWTSDLKWCNHVICPAVPYLICNKWRVYCLVQWCLEKSLLDNLPSLHILCHMYLITTFQILYIEYQPIYQITEFFYSLISLSAWAPKIPYQLSPNEKFGTFLPELERVRPDKSAKTWKRTNIITQSVTQNNKN